VGIGSESVCLLGPFDGILRVLDSEAAVKVQNFGDVTEGEVSEEMM